ncbi:uncharacterized protein [Equus caballus]|uniref:uncharacterized protein isoform X4 n=1 Tax=Equus caballus TaxID=9796 RepID=UPI000717BCDE
MRGTLGAWKCPTSRVVGCLARWWVRSSGQEGTSLSQASLGHPGRAIPRRESAQQPRRAVVVTWRTRVSPSPPSSGPRRASGRAWGAPDVSFLFYSYSPAGASLLGALLSGTNSPSAPVRSSVRRRARGRKGHAWSRKTERRSRSLVEESEAGKEEKMKRCLKTMAKTAGPTQHSRQHLCSSPGSSSTIVL